jgi:hypothetical protein
MVADTYVLRTPVEVQQHMEDPLSVPFRVTGKTSPSSSVDRLSCWVNKNILCLYSHTVTGQYLDSIQ